MFQQFPDLNIEPSLLYLEIQLFFLQFSPTCKIHS